MGERSLAYNVFNHTNNWGITLATGIVAIAFIASIDTTGSQVTIKYPNMAYWFVVIIAWIIMTRFYVRSCLALVNMYRWNTLIYAASKILSLPENDPNLPVFERNFARKVKAYYYEWRSPIPRSKLVWECFRLIYIWFFAILIGLIIWGGVVLYDMEILWIGGILLFLFPTGWEIYSFLKYRSFKYQSLDLEDEPEITSVWLEAGEETLPAEVAEEQTRNGLLKKYIVSQALTYFVFGLLSILAFGLATSKSMPVVDYENILDTAKNLIQWLFPWLLVVIGGLAIAWSLVLFIAPFLWRKVERMHENTFKRYQRWSTVFYWPALITVFGISFANILTDMIRAGMQEYYLLIIYALAMLVLIGLLLHQWRSSV